MTQLAQCKRQASLDATFPLPISQPGAGTVLGQSDNCVQVVAAKAVTLADQSTSVICWFNCLPAVGKHYRDHLHSRIGWID